MNAKILNIKHNSVSLTSRKFEQIIIQGNNILKKKKQIKLGIERMKERGWFSDRTIGFSKITTLSSISYEKLFLTLGFTPFHFFQL